MSQPKPRRQVPELLAPAGHIESFLAAIENGADAVYLGLKQLNARALATNFTLDELSWMIPYAEQAGVAVHVALNSLITAPELAESLDLLQGLSDLRPAALIVQDAGLFHLCRERFPGLPLHASTLMTVHNHCGVRALAEMGARRVVLARELSFDEIASISRQAPVELEIFVHGALCFSYSGLCLASSYRGGHSGLQGRCVQPCRLPYRQGRNRGYHLSCGDFSALEWLPRLLQLPLAAFKIEGRMKDAEYIGQVVRAYRLVLDAGSDPDAQAGALGEARELIAQSPARRLSSGHLDQRAQAEILTPHRSGSSGLWVGTVKHIATDGSRVQLRHRLQAGDHLRIESDQGRERETFTVNEIRTGAGAALREAAAGTNVVLGKTPALQVGERLFRVGGKRRGPAGLFAKIRKAVAEPRPYGAFRGPRAPLCGTDQSHATAAAAARGQDQLLVKLGDYADLVAGFQSPAHRVLLTATKRNLEKLARGRMQPNQQRRFIWSLPPIILEKDCTYYEKAVAWYCEHGYLNWELNNWGHFSLFERRHRPWLMAGARLNLRNTAALATVAELGCRQAVPSLEITLEELQALARSGAAGGAVICVYFWPALHVSRLQPKLQPGTAFFSPRNEAYQTLHQDGCTRIYADQPVSWLDHLSTLRALGYRRFLCDLSDGPEPQGRNLAQVVNGFQHERSDQPASLFNLQRRPLPERRRG